MIYLQSFYCKKNLLNLVCFGFPLIILNIYPWVALPRSFVNPMTAPPLTRFAKIMIAHLAQLTESDIPRILTHMREHVFYSTHDYIVSLVISLSSAIGGGRVCGRDEELLESVAKE